MIKEFPKNGTSFERILKGIREGDFYVDSYRDYKTYKVRDGYKSMETDLSAAEKVFEFRPYIIQDITIPEKQRGNLSEYRGQNVKIVFLRKTRYGRATFLIKRV